MAASNTSISAPAGSKLQIPEPTNGKKGMTAPTATEHTIKMTVGKECKHSVRYESSDPDAAISNVYLSKKAFPDGMPEAIEVRVAKA